MQIFSEINYLAAIAGAVVSYALGAVWFNEKVFGGIWMAAQPQRANYENQPRALALEALSAVLTALFVSALLGLGGLPAVIFFAVVMSVAHASGAMFLAHPLALWAVPAGYDLLRIAIIVTAHSLL